MTLEHEQYLWTQSILPIGIDEAGRGALAGPVVAAAVMLDPNNIPLGLDDSKKLTANRRASLRTEILASALQWGIGIIGPGRIDEVNILNATFEAMHAAIPADVNPARAHLLVDGNRFRPHSIAHTTLVGGDARCASIAAASILAKTHRDEILAGELHDQFPAYQFKVHKGYGTALHRQLIQTFGPTPVHRTTFLTNILAEINR